MIEKWLRTEHCGIRGIWIAMFSAGVLLHIIAAFLPSGH